MHKHTDAGERNPELSAPPSDNLYVKNLPPSYSEAELRALFASCGEVVECRLLHKGDGSQGAGALVRMGTMEEAGDAIAHLHGQRLPGAAAPLVVRYADSPEQKAKKQARQGRQQAERSSSLPSSVSSAPSGGLSSQGAQSSLGSSSSTATTIAVTAAAALALAPVPESLGDGGGSGALGSGSFAGSGGAGGGPSPRPSSSGAVVLRGPSATPSPYSPGAYNPAAYTPAFMHGAAPGAVPVPGYQAAGPAMTMYGGAAAYGAAYAYPPQQPPPLQPPPVQGTPAVRVPPPPQQLPQPPPSESGAAISYGTPPAGTAGGAGSSGGGAPPGSSIYIKHLPEQVRQAACGASRCCYMQSAVKA